MKPLQLTLKETLNLPLEGEQICPDVMKNLNMAEILKVPLQYGNKSYPLEDFFMVEGDPGENLELQGDLSRVKRLGEKMTCGTMTIHGDVGMHIGNGMSGGFLEIKGNAGDWLGGEMKGGTIHVRGNAGDCVGGAYRGSTKGLNNGAIVIDGNCGHMAGELMMRGFIAVLGDVGDYAGCMMKGGTIVVLGQSQQRIGGGMKRGTIICMNQPELLPTFHYDCRYQPTFMPLIWSKLRQLGVDILSEYKQGMYRHYSGDSSELGKGEIIVYDQT